MKELILSPEEIYFLGKEMDGDYLDYRYIEAMGDVEQRKAVLKQECIDSLCAKQVMKESMLGDLEINPDAVALMKPVFFSTFESAVDIYYGQEQMEMKSYLLYRNTEDVFLLAFQQEDGLFRFEKLDAQQVAGLLISFMPEKYRQLKESEEVKGDYTISRVLVFKNTQIEDPDPDLEAEEEVLRLDPKTTEDSYMVLDCGSILCREEDDETYVLSPDEYLENSYRIMTGGDINGIS